MRWVTTNGKQLEIRETTSPIAQQSSTEFEDSITSHAVHELLFKPSKENPFPLFPALLTARAALKNANVAAGHSPRRLAWIDATGTFYPPAALSLGFSPEHIYVLRPRPKDVVWAAIELLRCRSVGAMVALMTQPLTRVEARRLQLAAETGGGTGVLIRPNLANAVTQIYAAATRWRVTPMPGERTIQRWCLELVHGHGRQIGQSFLLEKHRATGESHFVHLSAALVHHPTIPAAS